MSKMTEFTPPNEDTSLPNRHKFVAAKTGGGKSQAMRNIVVPASGIRAIFWDPDKDHNCKHFNNRREFLAQLARSHRSRKPFRLGWSGDSSKATFAWWCEAVWRSLDGAFDTWIVSEELADLDMKKIVLPQYNTLSKRSRKYGGILCGNTQRIQEVPNTFVTQAAEVWIGLHEFQDAEYIQQKIGLNSEEVAGLPELDFFVRNKSVGPDWKLTTVKYKKFGTSLTKRNQFKT